MKAILLIITTALLMIACGPTYNVKHTYTLPESKDIKTCVLQCRSIELQCEQNELLKDPWLYPKSPPESSLLAIIFPVE